MTSLPRLRLLLFSPLDPPRGEVDHSGFIEYSEFVTLMLDFLQRCAARTWGQQENAACSKDFKSMHSSMICVSDSTCLLLRRLFFVGFLRLLAAGWLHARQGKEDEPADKT